MAREWEDLPYPERGLLDGTAFSDDDMWAAWMRLNGEGDDEFDCETPSFDYDQAEAIFTTAYTTLFKRLKPTDEQLDAVFNKNYTGGLWEPILAYLAKQSLEDLFQMIRSYDGCMKPLPYKETTAAYPRSFDPQEHTSNEAMIAEARRFIAAGIIDAMFDIGDEEEV
jgi:hypothetical protein